MTQKYNLIERLAAPTLDTNIYASGDRLGSVVELSECGRSGALAKLLALTVIDNADQKAAVDLLVFNQDPTADISSADNAAFAISAAGAAKLIGTVSVAAADYVDIGAQSIAQVAVSDVIGRLGITPNKEGKLWVVLVSRGTPTYLATSLALRLVLEVND